MPWAHDPCGARTTSLLTQEQESEPSMWALRLNTSALHSSAEELQLMEVGPVQRAKFLPDANDLVGSFLFTVDSK